MLLGLVLLILSCPKHCTSLGCSWGSFIDRNESLRGLPRLIRKFRLSSVTGFVETALLCGGNNI